MNLAVGAVFLVCGGAGVLYGLLDIVFPAVANPMASRIDLNGEGLASGSWQLVSAGARCGSGRFPVGRPVRPKQGSLDGSRLGDHQSGRRVRGTHASEPPLAGWGAPPGLGVSWTTPGR